MLTEDLANRFARIALGHVGREYPNSVQHVFANAHDIGTPRVMHPIFYGSFDWHSCVHSHWMLAYLLRRFPHMEAAADIRALFDARFTPDAVAGECAYLERATSRGFQRPYGWGWLLKLASELMQHPAHPWAEALAPLTQIFVARYQAFLPQATYPVRVGTHFNTAFSLRMAADYANQAKDAALLDLLRSTALRWYGADRNAPAWGEPSGDDFLSSTLIEADCMRRLLPTEQFATWFEHFLPHIAEGHPAILFAPATVSDRSDGKIAHLDGLNISRAWCWQSLATTLPAGDVRRARMEEAAAIHLHAGLPHVAGDYMGEHWLASYAVLALDAGAII